MTLDQIKYALELQKTRHFSNAAENCMIAQPSLSVQIAKLESELGVPLFVRTRAGVEVTDHGEILLKQMRNVMDEALRVPQLAKDLKGEIRGRFRLGIISTLAPSLLPLFVTQFGINFPDVELEVTEDRTESLVRSIDCGELDAAILSTPQKCPESLMERVLFYEPFSLFASTGHEILNTQKVNVAQISPEQILLLDETHCLRDQVLQLCRAKQKSGHQKLSIHSASLQTLIEIIRHGRGYTMLPILSTDLLSASERQKNIRSFHKPLPSRKVSLVFHRSRIKRSLIDALRESVLESLPENVFLTSSRADLRVLSPGSEHFEI